MKKLKSLFKKYGARIGALAMCFMLLIPMLCSATGLSYSVPYTLSNPDNIPQDFTISVSWDTDKQYLDFGSGNINAFDMVTVSSGSFTLSGTSMFTTVPDGEYLIIPLLIEQPSGYASAISLTDGIEASFNDGTDSFRCFYTDSLDLVVVEREDSDLFIDLFFVFLSLPSTPTDSFTSVWTSITNWVISSLNSVQGVFYGASDTVYSPDYSESIIVNDVNYYPMGLFDMSLFQDDGYLYYNGSIVDYDVLTTDTISSGGITYTAIVFDDVPVFIALGSLSGSFALYSLYGYSFVTTGEAGLTLLGTLTVIGLSIAVVFLLIGIIQRFLKLRG